MPTTLSASEREMSGRPPSTPPLDTLNTKVMPFGLTNAPAVFQAMINDVLRDMLNRFIFVYLDDILIFSRSLPEHTQHVRQVLQRLLENQLFVKAEKCEFHVSKVSFLGFIIAPGQLHPDPSKIKAVENWPTPSTRKKLQQFLGFANFYRRFIRNYSKVAAPLTCLTSTTKPFLWTPEAERAFTLLKSLFTSAPILSHPDPSLQFIVEVDASETGIGAVLSQRCPVDQNVHPCAFFSRRLTPAERNYDVGNRELLAVVLALQEWRHWLEGAEQPFLVWTDHKNLAYLRSAKRLNPRQVPLGPVPEQFSLDTSPSEPASILPPSCIVGAASWDIETRVQEALKDHPAPNNCPKDRLFVPSNLRSLVLQWIHTSKFSCHPGIRRTSSPSSSFSNASGGPGWLKTPRNTYVNACSVCARGKSSHRAPAGFLKPLPIPHRPWSHIAVDFVSGLPPSQALETASLLTDHVFRLHGLPTDIVSDRGPQFTSQVCPHLWLLTAFNLPFSPVRRRTRLFPSVQAHLRRCRGVWRAVRAALVRSSTRSQKSANKLRRPVPDYLPGQKVWLSSRDLPLQVPSRKLAGPSIHRTICCGEDHQPLLRPSQAASFSTDPPPTFHASLLKPFTPSELCPPSDSPPPPAHRWTPSILKLVKEVLDVRRRGRGYQYLVDWEGYGPEERSWISRKLILDNVLLRDYFILSILISLVG
ncbi:hypothetical protein L3Q82_024432 [Scortum barcoo]|uniref:Uncharacterized protein n=1 Tax=Scortum barcoo TaxID=214431 RepID=A0ACB8WPP5_9TELE|nr:hypothetical protein L3Q82_024432 [Scortum barcoo]